MAGMLPLKPLWNRRQTTKYNGCPYIVQRAAEAVYSPEGRQDVRDNVGYYMENASTIRGGLQAAELDVYGGVNAPYIWLKTPGGMDSWHFFEAALEPFRHSGDSRRGVRPER